MQNMYIDIEAIPGESSTAQGQKMIEILSFSHGVSMPLTSGASNTSRASGRCVHQDFTFTKYFDITSPTLALRCSSGKDIKYIKMHVWKADAEATPHEYITYVFDHCIITSVSVGGGGDQPIETVSFNYRNIVWTYNKQEISSPGGNKGKVETSWSLEKNTGK